MFLQLNAKLRSITSKLPAIIALLIIIALWQLLCMTGIVPNYMLPSPVEVVTALINDFSNIIYHTGISVTETIIGLCLGVILAFVIATIMERFLTMNKAFYPLLIISQTIPTIAIAPILVLWMGFGMAPKITLVIITTFFPMSVGLLDGYKSVDPDAVHLMRSMGASRRQIFFHAKLPAAMPHFFSGLKISASYAVVGAVVSEWLGGFEGLGVYMTRVKKAYAFDKMFAAIVVIIIISLLLILIVNIIRKRTMPWERVVTTKHH